MSRIKVYWGGGGVHVYHGIALGGTLNTCYSEYSDKSEKNTREYDIAFQLTAFGFDVVIGNVLLYTELGVGMQGTWSFGGGLAF
jgi:hypothetical protein